MSNFDEVVERLKDIISQQLGQKKVFDKDVASALGVEPVSFATMKKRDKIPYKELCDFCAKRKISLNWILFNQTPESLVEATNKYYEIKCLSNVSASAGGGAENYDYEGEYIALPESFIPALGGEKNLKNIEAIRVVGDSMEPTLTDKATVFIDKAKKDPKKGGVFAIASSAGLFIKRLNQKINGEIEIISDNKDYPLSSASPNDFFVVGKAIASFNRVY